jgi:hypothetical protein
MPALLSARTPPPVRKRIKLSHSKRFANKVTLEVVLHLYTIGVKTVDCFYLSG